MVLVPIEEIAEGTFTAQDIRSSSNTLLLAQGTRLTDNAIKLLKLIGITGIYVEQEETDDIVPKDVISTELRVQCTEAFEHAMHGFQRQAKSRNLSLDISAVQNATYGMVEEILAGRNTIMALLDIKDWDNRFFQHAVNTSVLATLIARQMRCSEADCKNLAMGMLFHDTGQLSLPQAIFDKRGTLTGEEREIVRKHSYLGFQQTLRGDILNPMAAYVVLRHHERMDGTGYPGNMKGEDIHRLARIAAVTEVFDSMTSLRPWARPMMPDQAIYEIISHADTHFDRAAASALVQNIAIYPTGSAVRLNTGECGIVVESRPGHTTRPLVRLFYAPNGVRMKVTDIDLSRERNYQIVHSAMSMQEIRRMGQRILVDRSNPLIKIGR